MQDQEIENTHKSPGLDNMIRKMEKVELEMLKWNSGVKKMDPIQIYYC
jgi:hypothetical protein